jgi:hypothetical protein
LFIGRLLDDPRHSPEPVVPVHDTFYGVHGGGVEVDMWGSTLGIVAVLLAGVGGCCSADAGHEGVPPGFQPPIPPILKLTEQGDDDSAAPDTPADDDSATVRAETATNAPGDDDDSAPTTEGPDLAQVRADLDGRMICYEGEELAGFYWTIRDAQLTSFEETWRRLDPDTGEVYVDLKVTLAGPAEELTGSIRATYSPLGDRWLLLAVTRTPATGFQVKVTGEVSEQTLADRRLQDLTCEIVTSEGMCWEYDRATVLDLGLGAVRGTCRAYKGTLTEDGCPASGRKAVCTITRGYRIHYYEAFDVESAFLSHAQHCEAAGGVVSVPR